MFKERLHRLFPATFFVIILLLALLTSVSAQQRTQALLVGADDASLSVLDLTTNLLLESFPYTVYRSYSVQVGNNPRLAFIANSSYYLSVMDLTLGLEIKRIYDVWGTYSALTSDGKYLLMGDDYYQSIDVVDTVALKLVKRVSLTGALGKNYSSGSIVVVGNKAYMAPYYPDPNRSAMAVMDLTTFAVTPITLPSGYPYVNQGGVTAAATPDGKYVVTFEDLNSDGSSHLYFIDTATDTVALDRPLNTIDPSGIAITPDGHDPSKVFGYVAQSGYAEAIDLRPGSETFGSEMPATLVSASVGMPISTAISPDGSRLIIGGYRSGTTPQPNLAIISTAPMQTDPAHALLARPTVGGGARTRGITVASVVLEKPDSAPTLKDVAGAVVNDIASEITITGSNFRQGAVVRIGSMAPIPAAVDSSSSLRVTVPKHAPAGFVGLVVTNPDSGSPVDQQYQSGGGNLGLKIGLNPAFQPTLQFASLNRAFGGSISIFDMNLRMMTMAANPGLQMSGLAFNLDGAELYGTSNGPAYRTLRQAIDIRLSDNSIVGSSISLPGTLPSYQQVYATNHYGMAMAIPQVYRNGNGHYDLEIAFVDSNPQSPTYNTIVDKVVAGHDYTSAPTLYGFSINQDGNYAVMLGYRDDGGVQRDFVQFFEIYPRNAYLLDIDFNRLFIDYSQFVYLTPYADAVILHGFTPGYLSDVLYVFDMRNQSPRPVTIRAPRIANLGTASLYSVQVVGNRLYAWDPRGYVVAYNFNPQAGDYRYLNMYKVPGNARGQGGLSEFAVSPFGTIYVPMRGDDAIAVLDGDLLATGKDPLITKIADQQNTVALAISPVPPPVKLEGQSRKSLQQEKVSVPGKRKGRGAPVER